MTNEQLIVLGCLMAYIILFYMLPDLFRFTNKKKGELKEE